jgi:uncharacterized membrane protein (DUF485 family)
MASPAFGRVTAGINLAIIAAVRGFVLPSYLAGSS